MNGVLQAIKVRWLSAHMHLLTTNVVLVTLQLPVLGGINSKDITKYKRFRVQITSSDQENESR